MVAASQKIELFMLLRIAHPIDLRRNPLHLQGMADASTLPTEQPAPLLSLTHRLLQDMRREHAAS